MLAELGTVGDLEPGTEFVEDVSDLVAEVLDDLYVRRFQSRGGAPFNRAEALRIARAAVFNPTAELEPRNAPQQSIAAMRYRLAGAVRDGARAAQAADGDHDLRRSAHAPATDISEGRAGRAATARLRSRYRRRAGRRVPGHRSDSVADPAPRVRAAEMTLVLIADPKQAIYAFRGADIYAYLMAARTAATRATLQVKPPQRSAAARRLRRAVRQRAARASRRSSTARPGRPGRISPRA